MSARPFMPLWCGDFLADTEHLNCAESGAYLLLLVHLWLTGKLPDDDRRLARIARATTRQWRSMRPILEPFFDIGSVAGWQHKRVEAERVKASAYSEIQRARINGRWGKTDTAGNTRARATSHSHSQTGGNDVRENRSLVAAARRAHEVAERQLAEHLAGANGVDHNASEPALRVVPKG